MAPDLAAKWIRVTPPPKTHMVTTDHIVEFYKLLGGGQRDAGWQREYMATNRLAILPDLTHYEMFDGPQLANAMRPFLDGKTATPQVSKR